MCKHKVTHVTHWHCFSLHPDTTPPQPNHTVTPTHIEPEQHNTLNKSTISRKLLKMDVLTFETCWALNNETIKQVTSSWSIFIQLYLEQVFHQVGYSLHDYIKMHGQQNIDNLKYIKNYIYLHISTTKIILQRGYIETRVFQRKIFFCDHFQAFCHVDTSTLNFPYNPQCIWQHSKQHSM